MVRTNEQILVTITAARDSVWVIEDAIEKLNGGKTPSKEIRGNIDRNVSHLKLVVSDEEIVNSGEDIADIHEAIVVGEAKLAEDIWPSDS